MARDYAWIDDRGRMRRSTEVVEAADVTNEILGLARVLESSWFANYVWIDWPSFFADLDGTLIPSTGRELDLGEERGSPAMKRIQRHIQKRRMASISRWRLAAARQAGDREAPFRPVPLHLVVEQPD